MVVIPVVKIGLVPFPAIMTLKLAILDTVYCFFFCQDCVHSFLPCCFCLRFIPSTTVYTIQKPVFSQLKREKLHKWLRSIFWPVILAKGDIAFDIFCIEGRIDTFTSLSIKTKNKTMTHHNLRNTIKRKRM